MVIQCPYCATRFHLDEARLSGPQPMLKCSRCRHIFPAPSRLPTPSPTPSGEQPAPPSPPPAPQNLTFSFSEPTLKEPQPDLTIDEPEPDFELGTEPADHVPGPTLEVSPPPERRAQSVVPLADRTPHLSAADTGEEDDTPAEQFDEETFEEENSMPRAIPLSPVFIFLLLVVAGYGVLASTLRGDPALADSLFRKLPLISTLTEDRLLNRKIVLKNLSGAYQQIRNGDTVFVITGQALNNSAVTLRNVQILGRLFDSKDVQLDEKAIFCGNVISTKILGSLTEREVSILQELRPPRRFGVAPGEEATFVIVFMKPPGGVAEFSGQVIRAERQA